MLISRRTALLAATGSLLAPRAFAQVLSGSDFQVPPLYCVAYITPKIPAQAGQEKTIARYPLTLVSQATDKLSNKWRDTIKSINPDIIMLGYHDVIDQTTVPGPGHAHMSKLKDAWCVRPDGVLSATGPASKRRYIFDPRKPSFQSALVEACQIVMESYPYDGLLLDQCTIYRAAHPDAEVREEMLAALRESILKVRQALPNTILIGNSSYDFPGLNGEMLENRPSKAREEIKPFPEHTKPEINLFQLEIKNTNEIDKVKSNMALAHELGASFGCAVNYQQVLWYDFFDDVMRGYKRTI
ncbi:MAG: hypothetical protein E6Q98_10870 [Rhodospirillaceae bacterium]|nr:MAG: hypothetical protein E6Q98_10870 [Rhodospirillaceae bacterium]